ncbi:hypothetical protein HMPREF2724_11535 [Corynebacterium sp. HMSC071F07]|uniref:ECF transporter S component n=1 Tax=Corynebacterium sp. HMSC071F07 TaxID=1715203 RepID=UPI0008A4FA12|nr:ECF transporter S component [Corynebacterium sp. HMSC071F07]OFL98595.1 hypothetical protein HMPREF2724_11535 [Corynebacterium sp. HMSC071F07]
MSTTPASSARSAHTAGKPNRRWRVVDIVVAAVLSVACGLIFLFWNTAGYAGYEALDAFTPGLGGLASGIWLLGGVLGGLIIRKPGAALFVELLAACVSAALGSQWGAATLLSGIAQGIGVEIVFAIFAYRSFNLLVATIAGLAAGVGAWTLELFTAGHLARSVEYNIISLVCTCLSGAILAGVLGYFTVKALAATGALDRFAAGREA